MSRPAYKPTDKDRAVVKAMASYGIPQEDIGREIGCSHVTLRKYYCDELELSHVRANAKVAEVLFACAIDPDPRHNNARFFWLKTRAGWRETERLELAGDRGAPVELRVEYADKSIPE